ncbi:MAG TPA: Ig-like domain-containing protein [Thermoanaerobaculia bacterium]|nr:Ig-like domain-containing protein [Thermoanaerobaculia bacterium]
MRSLSVRLLLSFLVVLVTPALLAHDVTLSGTQSFASIDGSASDHDGAVNGVFTVDDGNLTVNGVVNCNDDGASASACAMAFNVSGNLTINNGGALYAENRSGSGTGASITLTVGGNFAMNGNAIVSTASKSSSGSIGGAITANVAGDVALASGTTIDSGASNAAGGAIVIGAAGSISVDGNVLSGPSRTILSTRLNGSALDGGTSNQIGGSITIASTTFEEPAVLIGPNANVISQGETSGAGPVTIDGCGIQVRGLVAALSRKDAAARVAIRSGKDVLIDGRDLAIASGTRKGRVRADAPTGSAINKGVDVFATETIEIYGPVTNYYTITSLPGVHDSKSYGGVIRIISVGDAIIASGNVIDDGHSASGDTGGSVDLAAKETINLDGASIRAVGDFNTGNPNRGGGSIHVRSYSGNVIWTNGFGEVRPVGSSSGLTPADQGSIVLTACGTVNTTGSTFPVMGVATSVFPETHTGVCSPAAPSLPAGTLPLVTCNTPPVANDVTASTNEDTTVTITLSGSDVDGDPLTFSIVTPPANGSLGPIVPTGPTTATVNYTPNLDYNGTDSFVYQANDGNGGTDNATVTITIVPVNDPPSFLVGPTVNVLEDSGPQTYTNWVTSISAGPANESGQVVTFSVSNDNPALFTVQPSVASNGTLTFTPAPNVYGSATVTVTAHDNGGTANGGVDTSASQSSTINVNGVNDEPSFVAGANQTVLEDAGPQTVPGWATGINAGPNESGQSVTFVVSSDNPSLFSAGPSVAPNGTLTYTPAANANGSATVSVYLQDDGGTANGGDDTSATQTFTITVTPVNDAPSFTSGGNVTVDEDSGAYSGAWATSISAGPADESGQTVSFTAVNDNNALFSVQPAIDASGNLTFTPAANAFGSANVMVTLSDNGGTANGGADTSASQTFTITISAVNDEPSFTAGGNVTVNEDSGAYSAAWATAISAGAGESQTLTFVVSNDNNALFASQPSIDAAGTLTFTPSLNANGTATVTVYLTDDGGTANGGDDTSASVTFTIDVTPVNDEPSFVSGGDVSVNEDSAAYSAAWATSISAGPANESSQNVTFFVSNNNNALFSVQPSLSPSGVLSFTVAANATGSATVSVYLQDDGGTANGGDDTSATQTFTISVNAVNDAPSFTSGGDVTVNEDSGAYSAAWASAISAGPGEGGQTVTFVASNNNNALFSVQPTISSTGVLSFTPAPNAFGSATVSVYAQDNGGTANGGVDTSATITFTITVNGINDPPAAGNDSWETFGNTELRVDLAAGATPHVADTTPSGSGVLDNDVDAIEGDPFSITGVVGCADTTAPYVCAVTGGTVTLNANGTFSFQPNPGATSGSFQYTVTDAPSAGVPASANGTVTITFHEMIWYVNGSAAAGNGTSSSPFNSLTPLNGVGDPDDNDDYIFVHASSLSSSITLEQGQRLWGEAVGLILPHNLNGNGGPTVLVPAGLRPTVATTGTTVSVPGVSAEVAGLALNSGTGNAIDVTSAFLDAASTVSIYNNIITGAALEGIDVNAGSSSGTTVLANNNNITSTGNGFDASGTLGTVNIGFTNATVTSTAGSGVRIEGTAPATVNVVGLSNVTVSGTTAIDGIRVTSAQFDSNPATATFETVSGGTIAVGTSGDPVGAAGVVLFNVSGSVAFGSLSSYASTTGVSVIGSGLFTGTTGMQVTSGGGDVSTLAGIGLAVNDATIGAANLSFTSISATGGTSGISLSNTGTVGGLKVLGTGAPNSGGTIHNAGVGVRLLNTAGTSLAWMHLHDFSDYAIRGNVVSGFSMSNTTIDGVNGNDPSADEASVSFAQLTGSASISNSTISGGIENNMTVLNTSGVLNRLTITSTTFGSMSTATGDDALLIDARNTAVVNVTVQNSTFTSARGDHFQLNLADTASSDLVFSGNSITNNHPAVISGGGGIRVTGGGSGSNVTGTLSITNNTMRDSLGTAIGVTKGAGTGSFSGTITGNAIGVAGIPDSGSSQGSGISVVHAEGGSSSINVTNNVINQYGNFGIFLQTGGTAVVGSGTLKSVVTGNTVANPGSLSFVKNGFHLNAGTLPGDTYQVCLTLGGAGALANSITGSGDDGGTDFRLRQRQSTTVRLPGYAGANNDNAAVTSFVQSNNGGTPTGNVANTVPTGGGYIGGTCP